MDKPALVYEPIEKPSRGNSTCAWILVFTPFWVHEVLRHTETETETETETGQLLRHRVRGGLEGERRVGDVHTRPGTNLVTLDLS